MQGSRLGGGQLVHEELEKNKKISKDFTGGGGGVRGKVNFLHCFFFH